MTDLREEWSNIIKVRESGSSGESKNDQIKSRIFNNFYSALKSEVKTLPDIAEVAQAPEFRSTKLALQSTLLNFERSKTPESAQGL